MDTEKIKTIVKMFEESQLSKMDLKDGDLHLILEKDMQPTVVAQEPQVKTVCAVEENTGLAVKSPLVGTYYQASGQGQEPFVQVGSFVNEGDTVCIIEAMKVMNEIKAPQSGTIVCIAVEDGQTIEFDETLMVIG